jgi:hypothetical protein
VAELGCRPSGFAGIEIMDKGKTTDALKEEITRAFSDVPHPGAPEKICDVPCCTEHDAVAEWSSLHTWEDLARDLETLDYEPTNWVFFHPEAYRYFLPGALMFIVQNADRDPEGDSWGTRYWRPLDWARTTIIPYGYSGVYDGMTWREEFRSRYLTLFSINQKAVVIRVLEFLCVFGSIPEESKAETISEVQTAIKEIWTAGT